MKKLLLLLLFSGSLTAFSQDSTTIDLGKFKGCTVLYPMPIYRITPEGYITKEPIESAKPDTIRAIILLTLFPNGIAHSRPGFVVIAQGKRPVYLDVDKRALKWPQVGWDWREVNPNEILKN